MKPLHLVTFAILLVLLHGLTREQRGRSSATCRRVLRLCLGKTGGNLKNCVQVRSNLATCQSRNQKLASTCLSHCIKTCDNDGILKSWGSCLLSCERTCPQASFRADLGAGGMANLDECQSMVSQCRNAVDKLSASHESFNFAHGFCNELDRDTNDCSRTLRRTGGAGTDFKSCTGSCVSACNKRQDTFESWHSCFKDSCLPCMRTYFKTAKNPCNNLLNRCKDSVSKVDQAYRAHLTVLCSELEINNANCNSRLEDPGFGYCQESCAESCESHFKSGNIANWGECLRSQCASCGGRYSQYTSDYPNQQRPQTNDITTTTTTTSNVPLQGVSANLCSRIVGQCRRAAERVRGRRSKKLIRFCDKLSDRLSDCTTGVRLPTNPGCTATCMDLCESKLDRFTHWRTCIDNQCSNCLEEFRLTKAHRDKSKDEFDTSYEGHESTHSQQSPNEIVQKKKIFKGHEHKGHPGQGKKFKDPSLERTKKEVAVNKKPAKKHSKKWLDNPKGEERKSTTTTTTTTTTVPNNQNLPQDQATTTTTNYDQTQVQQQATTTTSNIDNINDQSQLDRERQNIKTKPLKKDYIGKYEDTSELLDEEEVIEQATPEDRIETTYDQTDRSQGRTTIQQPNRVKTKKVKKAQKTKYVTETPKVSKGVTADTKGLCDEMVTQCYDATERAPFAVRTFVRKYCEELRGREPVCVANPLNATLRDCTTRCLKRCELKSQDDFEVWQTCTSTECARCTEESIKVGRLRTSNVLDPAQLCTDLINDCMSIISKQSDLPELDRARFNIECKRLGGSGKQCLREMSNNVQCFSGCRQSCYDSDDFEDWQSCVQTCSSPCFTNRNAEENFNLLPSDSLSSYVISRCYSKANNFDQIGKCHELERNALHVSDSSKDFSNCMDNCLTSYINGQSTADTCFANCRSGLPISQRNEKSWFTLLFGV